MVTIKFCTMERNSTQQEILLVTGSNFFQQQCFEKNEQDSNKNLSQKERIEEACWNGMLEDLLPGLIEKNAEGKSLLLWHIKHANAFLELDLCDSPEETDAYYSVSPHVFVRVISES